MRRKDKQIENQQVIEQILAKAQVCRLGLCKDNRPYIVPVSFGYDGRFLYFHTARTGLKIDFIAANNRVCFELEHEVKLLPNEASPCQWSFAFSSVIGFGTVEEIADPQRKVYGLNQIMLHYSGREWPFDEPSLENIRLWRLVVEQITGKQS